MNRSINFNDMQLVSLSKMEEAEISGGFAWMIPLAIALGASALNNFGDMRRGYADGFNGTPLSGGDCDCQ